MVEIGGVDGVVSVYFQHPPTAGFGCDTAEHGGRGAASDHCHCRGADVSVALICTEHAHQPAINKEFPQLAPHEVLKKWLYIGSLHEDFEPTMERVAAAIARDDQRFGIHPHPRKERVGSRSRRQKL